ncbi:MAG: class I SAM-dependent methyltransferase [Flammeovirgaceae bacterium]
MDSSFASVNAAFSKQAAHYDADDIANPILQQWRHSVYRHVENFLKPGSRILELNPGTGIDALHFIRQGHSVLGVELSQGMVHQLENKIEQFNLKGRLQIHHGSFENLNEIDGKFDYVFSNFGGLNCCHDLHQVTRHLSDKLQPNAFVTWVIMPPFCPWEIMWAFKGHFKQAFRRFHPHGVMAHLEGEYFKTYYYSLADVKKALGANFKLVACEGLGVFSPPPSASMFSIRYPKMFQKLVALDLTLKKHLPFNRIGDHLVITTQFHG